jgi:hypothetical protein
MPKRAAGEKADVNPGPTRFVVLRQRKSAAEQPKARDQPQNNPDEVARRVVSRPDGFILRAADASHQHYQDANEQRAENKGSDPHAKWDCMDALVRRSRAFRANLRSRPMNR